MNPDPRTIADLRASGFDGIRAQCPRCDWTLVTWWGLLDVPDDLTFPDLVSKLTCRRCGAKPGADDVTPCRKDDGAPKRMF